MKRETSKGESKVTDIEKAAEAYRKAKSRWQFLATSQKELEEQRDDLDAEIERVRAMLREAQGAEIDAQKALLAVAQQSKT